MTTRLAGWIVGALAVALVLSMLASSVGGVALLLAVPVAVVASILTRRPAEGHTERDVAARLVAAAATLTGERASAGRHRGRLGCGVARRTRDHHGPP